MADVDAAIDYTLRWEDSTLSGVITTDPGGRTRYGIAQKYHPELTACGFYNDMGSVAALQIARKTYNDCYAVPLSIAEMSNQDVANKVLSLGVNIGIKTAGEMLQLALKVPCDGSIGPRTLFALASANYAQVHESLDNQAIAHYHAVVANDPSKQKYLDGWIARAEA